MECIVCKNLERDVRDIQRRITERLIDQQRVGTVALKQNIGLELGVLAASKSEIEGRYLKHKRSSPHQEAAGAKIRGHLSFS
jgi:hypothetical protein